MPAAATGEGPRQAQAVSSKLRFPLMLINVPVGIAANAGPRSGLATASALRIARHPPACGTRLPGNGSMPASVPGGRAGVRSARMRRLPDAAAASAKDRGGKLGGNAAAARRRGVHAGPRQRGPAGKGLHGRNQPDSGRCLRACQVNNRSSAALFNLARAVSRCFRACTRGPGRRLEHRRCSRRRCPRPGFGVRRSVRD